MSFVTRRNWALRLSIVLNVCVLLYVCTHLTSSGPWIEEPPSNWGGMNVAVPLVETYLSENVQVNSSHRSSETPLSNKIRDKITKGTGKPDEKLTRKDEGDRVAIKQVRGRENAAANRSKSDKTQSGQIKTVENQANASEKGKPGLRQVGGGGVLLPALGETSLTAEQAIICDEKSSVPRTAQRGDYWVLYNYAPMAKKVKCWESVTYATHGDYTFLDNIEPLLERWRAPVSIAVYAPGNDFNPTLDAIKYARNCGSGLVSLWVTFHVYFSSKHVPKTVPRSETITAETYNCSLGAPWANVVPAKIYRQQKKLLYPVNVGRNIARECATTHYVILSDIELYPSPNLSSTFIEMIRKRDQAVMLTPNPKVYVLPIFEINDKSTPPSNKTVLREMLKNGSAIPFHKKLCSMCHNVPKSKEWQEAPQTNSLRVFYRGKRTGKFARWEPIFIGTNADPIYDERLSWEGKSDKMTQGYTLCILDYDFLILNDAFLVHRPGIKIYKKDPRRDSLAAKTNSLIRNIIAPELKAIFGTRKECVV